MTEKLSKPISKQVRKGRLPDAHRNLRVRARGLEGERGGVLQDALLAVRPRHVDIRDWGDDRGRFNAVPNGQILDPPQSTQV